MKLKKSHLSISCSHVQTGFIITGLHTSAGHHTASEKTLNTWGFLGWLNRILPAYSTIRVVTVGSCSLRMLYCQAEEPLVLQCFKSFTFVKVFFTHWEKRLLAQLMVLVTTDNEQCYSFNDSMEEINVGFSFGIVFIQKQFPLILFLPITIKV